MVAVTAVFGLASADFVGLNAQQLARVGRQQDDGAVQVIVKQNLTVPLLMMLFNYREELTSVDVLKIPTLVFVVWRRRRR